MNDILLDNDFDLAFANGDIATGESTRQHQLLLLLTAFGEWRENPTIGVGLDDQLDDEGSLAKVEATIKKQFEDDGMTVVYARILNDTIQTDAYYKG